MDCFQNDDLIGIGMEADAVRRKLHPEGVVSYVVDRVVFCPVPGTEAMYGKIRETIEMGGTGIVLQGTVLQGVVTVGPTIDWLEEMLIGIRRQFPSLWVHGLSASEIVAIAAQAGIPAQETIRRLADAGLSSIAGDDAGILHDSVQTTVQRCSTEEWIGVHRAAHGLGVRTTASMTFGVGETMEHRVDHLETLRRLQEETAGFTAFTPSAFQPVASGVRGFEEATAVEYLKTLAISRMFLDNIDNVQADWAKQGLKVLQMGLRFGGNDVGSVMPGEALIAADGTTEEDLRRVIRGAGFKPVQRDTLYRTMYLN